MSSAIYTPKPGSLAWRVMTFLEQNPGEELTRNDIAIKFDTQSAGVDTCLSFAVERGCLLRARNAKLEMVWTLGAGSDYRLEADPSQPTGLRAVSFSRPQVRIDLGSIEVRKGVRLLTPEERRKQEFAEWFDKFDIGDSAEFDVEHEPTIRAESRRHAKAKGTAFKVLPTVPGRAGIERTA